MRSSRTGRWSAVLLLALACASCRVTDLRLWTADVPEDDVREVAAVPYYQGPEYDPVRHRLDLYLPRGKSNFPVVVLVHGGAWRRGDNRCCGLYSAVGQFLASQGYGVVMPNYRLSPEVRHPAHITDVARAVAWTRACINEYGGDPERLYLAGHSAGGHLVSLLTTDEKYLAAEGLRPDILKGVLAVSGVYDLPPARQDVVLGGDTPLSFQLRQVAFLRREVQRRRRDEPVGRIVTEPVERDRGRRNRAVERRFPETGVEQVRPPPLDRHHQRVASFPDQQRGLPH